MRFLIAGLVVLAALAVAPGAGACHPVQQQELDLGPVTLYHWVDQGCPHAFPTACVVVVVQGGLPMGPYCV